jgi:hypothetical protein
MITDWAPFLISLADSFAILGLLGLLYWIQQ